jgi:hypothetical protein
MIQQRVYTWPSGNTIWTLEMLISISVEDVTMDLTTKSWFVGTRLLESTPITLSFLISQLTAKQVVKLCRDTRHSNFGSHQYQDCCLSTAKIILLSQRQESTS